MKEEETTVMEADTEDAMNRPDQEIPDAGDTAVKQEKKIKLSKMQLGIIAAAAAVLVVALVVLLIPSKFKKVQDECVQIAGSISSGDNSFTIETIPDSWDNMDSAVRSTMLASHQDDALEAIQYANKELGFDGELYDSMLQTSAIMGRQTEETDKYKVTWSYSPDDGLTVTYSKK